MRPRWQVQSGPWEPGGVAARILRRRGLDPAAERQHDPFLMLDMDRAVERIQRAIRERERILVFGDYDADGVTSAALLRQGLADLGATVAVRLPHRVEEGYGLQVSQMREILDGPTDLLVTADNGTSALEPLELAAREGLDVIVVDHHSLTGPRPPVVALLNPHQPGCGYPFKALAAVGVAWKLLEALGWRQLERGLDLVALGTVADMAQLTGENRLLIRRGLEVIRGGGRPGLEALLALPGVRPPQGGVDARTLGWQLGPRINCAGRLAGAELAFRLLDGGDRRETEALAAQLDALNQERRRVQDEAVAQAEHALRDAGELPAILIFVGADWHLGVIGLIAGRLCQSWERPVLVLSRVLGNGLVKGSARSVPGLNITEAIARQRDLLVDFGGHAEAAGLTLREEHLREFMARLGENLEERAPDLPVPELRVDSAVAMSELTLSLPAELEVLEPCGTGNPRPRLGLFGAQVERVFQMSQGKHLKLWLQAEGRRAEAVWWKHGPQAERIRYGQQVDVVFELGLNHWNGRTELQLVLEDLRPAEALTGAPLSAPSAGLEIPHV
ncbi:MAG: single-stranded-DNA-specific exonuclease RecJ [Candidatus Delongbacteria bacterium]